MKKLLFVIFLCSFLLVNAQEIVNINGNLVGYLKKSDFLNGKHKELVLQKIMMIILQTQK
jgi:hypothetical protein